MEEKEVSWMDISYKLLKKFKAVVSEEGSDTLEHGKELEQIFKKNMNEFVETADMGWKELGQKIRNDVRDMERKKKSEL